MSKEIIINIDNKPYSLNDALLSKKIEIVNGIIHVPSNISIQLELPENMNLNPRNILLLDNGKDVQISISEFDSPPILMVLQGMASLLNENSSEKPLFQILHQENNDTLAFESIDQILDAPAAGDEQQEQQVQHENRNSQATTTNIDSDVRNVLSGGNENNSNPYSRPLTPKEVESPTKYPEDEPIFETQSDTGKVLSSISGIVSDGYIKNATVFADANENGIWDVGEAKTTTDEFGNFTLTIPDGKEGTLVSKGGIDISTNLPTEGIYTAPSGSTTLSPLTTLITELSKDANTSVAQAKAILATSLGLDPSIDILTYDPIKAVENEEAQALSVQSAAVQVANIINQIGALLEGAGIENEEEGSLSAAQSVALVMATSGGAVDLTDSSTIQTIIEDTLDTNIIDSEIIESVSTAISNINTFIEEIETTSTNGSESLTQIAQTQIIAEKIEDIVEDAADGIDENGESDLDLLEEESSVETIKEESQEDTTPTTGTIEDSEKYLLINLLPELENNNNFSVFKHNKTAKIIDDNAPKKGGEIFVSEDGKSLIFKPNDDFNYLETGQIATIEFKYKIIDETHGLKSNFIKVTLKIPEDTMEPELHTISNITLTGNKEDNTFEYTEGVTTVRGYKGDDTIHYSDSLKTIKGGSSKKDKLVFNHSEDDDDNSINIAAILKNTAISSIESLELNGTLNLQNLKLEDVLAISNNYKTFTIYGNEESSVTLNKEEWEPSLETSEALGTLIHEITDEGFYVYNHTSEQENIRLLIEEVISTDII